MISKAPNSSTARVCFAYLLVCRVMPGMLPSMSGLPLLGAHNPEATHVAKANDSLSRNSVPPKHLSVVESLL